jgi:hypothetical protein
LQPISGGGNTRLLIVHERTNLDGDLEDEQDLRGRRAHV